MQVGDGDEVRGRLDQGAKPQQLQLFRLDDLAGLHPVAGDGDVAADERDHDPACCQRRAGERRRADRLVEHGGHAHEGQPCRHDQADHACGGTTLAIVLRQPRRVRDQRGGRQ